MMFRRMADYGLPLVIIVLTRVVAMPVTTYFIGPTEVGIFAVLLAFAGIFSFFSSSISGYILNHRYRANNPKKSDALSTCFYLDASLACIGAILFVLVWPWVERASNLGGQTSSASVLLMALAVPAATPWTTVQTIVLLEGRSGLFALSQSLSPIVQLAATTIGLASGWGVTGLCFGYLAGNLATAIFALRVMNPHWRKIDLAIFGDVRKLAIPALASNLMEAAMSFLERSILARTLTVATVGLYAHSQNYRGLLATGANLLTRSGYPVVIKEARDDPIDFTFSRRLWDMLFKIIVAAGVTSALLGPEIISFLTHGKFTNAAPLVPLWCMIVVLQQSARAQHFAMVARGRGQNVAIYKLIATALGALSLFVFIPLFGMFGPIAAIGLRETLQRGMLYVGAYRLWRIRFSDTDGIASLFVIALSVGVYHLLRGNFEFRLIISALASAFLLILILRDLWALRKIQSEKSEALN